jgi:glutamine amidotransferase
MPVNIDFSLREFKKRGAYNPHGFGFVFYEYRHPHLFKAPSSLAKEDITKQSFSFLSRIIIGHVRLASCGRKAHHNTHPFVQEKWSFAHNGTVREIKNRKLENFKPLGETDSNMLFVIY